MSQQLRPFGLDSLINLLYRGNSRYIHIGVRNCMKKEVKSVEQNEPLRRVYDIGSCCGSQVNDGCLIPQSTASSYPVRRIQDVTHNDHTTINEIADLSGVHSTLPARMCSPQSN